MFNISIQQDVLSIFSIVIIKLAWGRGRNCLCMFLLGLTASFSTAVQSKNDFVGKSPPSAV